MTRLKDCEENGISTRYEWGVFYHMYPLGTAGASKRNNPARVVGRLKELLQQIPHIKSLGCSTIYIGPFFESISHGYGTGDYKLVDRRLGGDQAFKDFVKWCHDPGIKVVVDGVLSHTGREPFVFKDIQGKKWDSPYGDWYRGVDSDWQNPCGDSFGYEVWQGHLGLSCLNLPNPEVESYLFDVIRFWVDEFGIDGTRLDCISVLDFNFMEEMRNVASGMRDDFWFMGKVIHGGYSRWVSQKMLYSVTNYKLHKSPYSGFNDHNLLEVAHNVRRLGAIEGQLYISVDNHDEDRIASKSVLKEHLFLIYPYLFTLSGTSSVYYGGE